MNGRIWTDKERAKLTKLYPDNYSEKVAKIIGRSVKSVYSQANLMGLKKSDAFMNMELEKQADRLRIIGVKNRYTKGREPENKGKKMPQQVYERCKGTMFKKGTTPPNAHEYGKLYQRKDSDGKMFWYVKAEQKTKPLHRWIWEQANGPIAKGFCVAFKDGNTLNCVIENLELISRAENMRRNTIQRYKHRNAKLHSEMYANIQLKKTITDLTKKQKI